ncbi:TetR/AcrR family transcriptional regulator [Mycolicibacter terrae]|uniref:TetR/AcrR family transcriptional regulator n=1 Tax=Mycolicibacter terrae TaxID=1788 RepID=UPI000A149780|nr:TetR/AcrR family transcriptional regulator [Mycolicibacter terrae]ORW89543.1 TetR family transcriptional regulator [Mycolicibacter terrae]SNV81459.1 transcription regulator AmtR [Mycolicibacter terrae]
MHTDRRGRPRLVASRRPGHSARDEILDAAAELFTTVGYAATSTRRIAESVGIQQASLYHHFAAKDDILDALLAGTVDASLQLAAELLTEGGPAAPRLHTLVVADTTQLCGGRWNLGTLYLLPELRVERFAAFRRRRGELRDHYRELSRAVIAEHDGAPAAEDLPFRLVESVINRRSDDGACPPDCPWTTAEAALRVLGCRGGFARMRKVTAERLALPPG